MEATAYLRGAGERFDRASFASVHCALAPPIYLARCRLVSFSSRGHHKVDSRTFPYLYRESPQETRREDGDPEDGAAE